MKDSSEKEVVAVWFFSLTGGAGFGLWQGSFGATVFAVVVFLFLAAYIAETS